MKNKTKAIVLIARLLLAATAFADEPPSQDQGMLNAIHEMRLKQQSEENQPVRVVQQPVTVRQDQVCSPAEMVRQRLQDVGSKDGKTVGTINVNAGHGQATIDNNSGQINNSVNVEVVNPNERKCF